jgi:hypothetical protein
MSGPRLTLVHNWSVEHRQFVGVVVEGTEADVKAWRKGRLDIKVCDVERADTVAELEAWFARVCVERPWESRT